MNKKPSMRLVFSAAVCVVMMLGACTDKSPQAMVAAGKAAAAKQDYRAAAIHFKAALQAEPNAPEVRYLLGRALIDAGDPESALVELGKAQDQKYAPEKVIPALAQALLLNGEAKKVATVYGDMSLDDPQAMASLKSSVATAWGVLGNRGKTEAAIKDALAAAPDFGPARLLEARVVAGNGEFEQARKLVDRILERDPKMYEAWMLKGELQARGKDEAGAEASFRKTVEIQSAYLPAHMALLSRLLRKGDIAGAKTQFEALKSVAQANPVTSYAEAQLAFAEKNLGKARDLSQQLLRIAPSDVSVLVLAGAVEGRVGSLVLAETYFNKALQIDPTQVTARMNLALIYLGLGQPVKSMETLQPLLAGPAESAQAHALAGDAELRQGRAAAAEAHFRRAAEMDPTDTRVAVAVALTGLSKGDPDSVFAELQNLAKGSKDLFADQAIVSARLRRGEYDEALKAVDAMARKQPDDATVPELRGEILKAKRDYPAARAAFEQALKLNPALYSSTASLASLDILEQKPDDARSRYEAAIASDAKNFYARMALAALQKRTGAKTDEIKATLTAAIQTSPGAAPPRLMLIDLLLRERQNKEALALARDAAAALPNDVAVLEAAGRAQSVSGEIEQALNTYRRLTNLLPDSGTPLVRLAELYRSSGRNDAAETSLRKAIEVEPRSRIAQAALIDLLLATKRGADAMEFARNQQRQNPKDANGYLLEGSVHLRQKAPEAAIGVYRKGLAAVGYSSEMARALYSVLIGSGKAAEAGRFAADWLRDHAEDYAFEYHIALGEIERGDISQAEARLTRIIAKLPDNALVMNSLAWVLTKQGKPGGLAYAQRAVDLLPNQPSSMDTLALALAADKQYAKALQTQQRAIELAPGMNELRLNLARIALQAGDKDLARRELEALKAMGTTFSLQDQVAELMKSL